MASLWSEVRPDLVAIIGTPLALLVTVHALLRKRDVPAAIGWIALAWLVPILGPVLYSLFGISRVSRRAREVRQDPPRNPADALPDAPGGDASPPGAPVPVAGAPGATARSGGAGRRTPAPRPSPSGGPLDDPSDGASEDAAEDAADGDPAGGDLAALRRGVETLTALPLTAGNRFTVLRDGDAAYPAMLAAIDGAASSVLLTTYIMRADRVGARFVDALARARERGAVVQVLLDGIGSGYFLPGAHGRLRRRGVPTARFMHSALPWRMPFLNLRTHKKLLVVDGRVAFLGGLNIGDEDVLSGRPREPVRDTHFQVEGPVVGQLTDDFARDWFFVTGEGTPGSSPTSPTSPFDPGAARGGLSRAVASGPDEDIEKIEFAVLQACACARGSIHLMTPYFLPDDVLVTALAMASMRGVEVNVLVPERSNHRLVDWASRAHVGPLLDRGVRLWLVPPPFDHSKLLVVDGAWCLIGSANMDARSLRLNFELDVEVYDADLAAELAGFMRARMRRRLEAADLDGRGWAVRLRDAAARLGLPYL